MALITLFNPDHPAVAATLKLYNQRKADLAEHVAGCGACTARSPLRYRNCKAGRELAMAQVAAHTAVINADAAACAEP